MRKVKRFSGAFCDRKNDARPVEISLCFRNQSVLSGKGPGIT